MKASSTFTPRPTPCRRLKPGERYEDQDGATFLTELILFSCGCRIVRHEYHDGSVNQTIVRHDGTTLVDELLSAQ